MKIFRFSHYGYQNKSETGKIIHYQ